MVKYLLTCMLRLNRLERMLIKELQSFELKKPVWSPDLGFDNVPSKTLQTIRRSTPVFGIRRDELILTLSSKPISPPLCQQTAPREGSDSPQSASSCCGHVRMRFLFFVSSSHGMSCACKKICVNI